MNVELDPGEIGSIVDLLEQEVEYHDTPDDQETREMYVALSEKLQNTLKQG